MAVPKTDIAGGGTIAEPIWFAAALLPMVVSQIIRLRQHDPGIWLFWDYAGRLGGLAALAAIPSARAVAFRQDRLQIALVKAGLWIVGIVLADHYVGGWMRGTLNSILPATMLGHYPQLSGWLSFADLVFGLPLVAFSEEIIFRRCANQVFRSCFKNDYLVIAATSLLFGVYHWWAGIGNIVEAALTGALLMVFFRRSRALWPVVLAHYLADLLDFA